MNILLSGIPDIGRLPAEHLNDTFYDLSGMAPEEAVPKMTYEFHLNENMEDAAGCI